MTSDMRLERIRRLWAALAALGNHQPKTAAYRQLVARIKVETDAWMREHDEGSHGENTKPRR